MAPSPPGGAVFTGDTMKNGFFDGRVMGEISREVTLRRTKDNKPVLGLNLKVVTGGNYSSTAYVGCTLWGSMAEEWAEKLNEGDVVMLRGDLRSRKKQTKEGGDYFTFELNVHMGGVILVESSSGQELTADGSAIPF